MLLQKKDFIEIQFIGKIKGGDIFDSNIEEELKKLNSKQKAKPVILCLGEGFFLKGVEDFLIGKKAEGEYNVELPPENAFGLRDSKLVQVIPLNIFTSQKINPYSGSFFNIDGKIVKILSVSGGRVTVDFNNPLAGKYVEYTIKILRKIDDLNEKIKATINLFFNKDLKYSLKDNKLILYADKELMAFASIFKEKFKEMLNLDVEIQEEAKESAEISKNNS